MKRSGETGRRGSGEAEINGKPEGSRHNGHRKKKTACSEVEQAGVPIDRKIDANF